MNNQFAENLKKIRKDHHLSQEQLADELGVSRQAISKWESSTAYPEMDKIIMLCDKFSLNIDDLLHHDIKEVKGEEESKRKVNKAFDDFLKFITDTINLFSNMNLNSKIRCLSEQIIIFCVLVMTSYFIVNIGNVLFFNLLRFLPETPRYFVRDGFASILSLFCIIMSLIIMVHVFKTRYLDYYDKIKSSSMKENIAEDKKDEERKENNSIDKNNKILFKKNENKIIIRDPKHSEYGFISSLFFIIIVILKGFTLFLSLFVCIFLIGLFVGTVLSFLLYKTGIFFIGLLVTLLSSILLTIIALLVMLNFALDRANNKKFITYSIIIGLATFGCGIGLTLVGSLNFDVLKTNETMLKTETREYNMDQGLFFNFYDSDIKYVEEDIPNIKVEYRFNKLYELNDYNRENPVNGIHIWVENNDPLSTIKVMISNLNDRKIIPISSEFESITIYASKENIEKMKNNENKFYDYNEKISYYEQKIGELEEKISEQEIIIQDYELNSKSFEE